MKNFISRAVAFGIFALAAQSAIAEDSYGGFDRLLNDKPYAWTIVSKPEPVRKGNASQRFELRDGDCKGADCSRDSQRIEVVSTEKFSMGSEKWIAWSVYIPKDFVVINEQKLIIGQVKQIVNKTENWPLVHFDLFKGNLGLVWHQLSNGNSEETIDNDRQLFGPKIPISKMKGNWTDFMLHIKFEPVDGFVEFYVNGQKKNEIRKGLIVKYSKKGRQYNETKNSNFTNLNGDEFEFRYGIYNTHVTESKINLPDGLPNQVIYFDEVRVGASRSDVDIKGAVD